MTPAATMPAQGRAPDQLDRWGEALADRVNPIVVKELRQGLRTRAFWVFFTLMLVANLFISLTAFASADVGDRTGRYTFIAFSVALGLVQFFVIPYTAYRSMAREREEETWVLLTLTGIGPRRVLAGKLGSFVLQGLLYSSASAPFLLFSYYLNGIDLVTIVSGMALSVAYLVFLTSVGVSIATLAESRLVRGLLHFVLLGALMQGLGWGLAGVAGISELLRSASGGRVLAWVTTGALFFFMISTGLVFFEAAAARLSLVTEDYARGPRLTVALQALGGVGLFCAAALLGADDDVLVAGALVAGAYAAFVGLFLASDVDGMAKNHWLSSRRHALLRPGAYRGYLFFVLLTLLCSAAFAGVGATAVSLSTEQWALIIAAPAFALLYVGLSLVLARWIPHPAWQTPAIVRLVMVALLVLGCGLPPLVGEILGDAKMPVLNLFNPIVGLINLSSASDSSATELAAVWAAAVGVTVWAWGVLRSRDGALGR
jgi:ABC-type transport system involved in multi-copper enzyme maturation permease subunit